MRRIGLAVVLAFTALMLSPFAAEAAEDRMGKDVLAALIAAAVAITLALWSLATARLSRSLALAAEEKAKRGELTRVKALEAIDGFLNAIADFLEVVGGLRFLVAHAGGISMETPSVRDSLKKFGEQRAVIARLRIRSSQYLTPDIANAFDDVWRLTETIDVQTLVEVENRLRDVSRVVADFARERYLS